MVQEIMQSETATVSLHGVLMSIADDTEDRIGCCQDDKKVDRDKDNKKILKPDPGGSPSIDGVQSSGGNKSRDI